MSTSTGWHRIDEVPDEGRVRTAVVDGRSVAVTRCGGRVGVLDNHCPHQGGPLGEGSIENGLLRCPWHGYDYDPTTGRPPEGFSDAPVAFPVEERADGTYVACPTSSNAREASRTFWWRRLSRGASTRCSAWSGTRTSASPTLCARPRPAPRSASSGSGTRAPPRSPHPPTASSPAAPRPASRSRGRARQTCSPACTTPAWTGRRYSRSPGRSRPRSWAAAPSRTSTCRRYSGTWRSPRSPCTPARDHAELAATAVKHALDGRGVAHLVLPDEVQDLPSDAPAGVPPAVGPTCPSRRRRRRSTPRWTSSGPRGGR